MKGLAFIKSLMFFISLNVIPYLSCFCNETRRVSSGITVFENHLKGRFRILATGVKIMKLDIF